MSGDRVFRFRVSLSRVAWGLRDVFVHGSLGGMGSC